MGNPEIKVLIEEISKLRSEMIEMKIEIEGLKADVLAIGELSKVNTSLKVVGENSIYPSGKLTLIKSKKIINEKNKVKESEVIKKQSNKKITKKISDTEQIEEKKLTLERKKSKEDLKIDKKDIKLFREKLKDIMKSEVRYDTWLKTGVENLTRTSKSDFEFPAANDFTRGIVEVRYKEMVLEVLKAIFGNVTSVKIVVAYK
ncbi:MAG: hypothetical protein ACRC6T_13940 [Sarcina sp.]